MPWVRVRARARACPRDGGGWPSSFQMHLLSPPHPGGWRKVVGLWGAPGRSERSTNLTRRARRVSRRAGAQRACFLGARVRVCVCGLAGPAFHHCPPACARAQRPPLLGVISHLNDWVRGGFRGGNPLFFSLCRAPGFLLSCACVRVNGRHMRGGGRGRARGGALPFPGFPPPRVVVSL